MTMDDHHIRTLVIKERNKCKQLQKQEEAKSSSSAAAYTVALEQQKARTLLGRLKTLLGSMKPCK